MNCKGVFKFNYVGAVIKDLKLQSPNRVTKQLKDNNEFKQDIYDLGNVLLDASSFDLANKTGIV